jgi:hypothetical protein
MKRYRVSVYFNNQEITVSAKNQRQARLKAYVKIDKKRPTYFLSKIDTNIYEI